MESALGSGRDVSDIERNWRRELLKKMHFIILKMPKSNKSKASVEKKSKVRSPQPDSRSASPLPRQIESPPAGGAPIAKSPFELPG